MEMEVPGPRLWRRILAVIMAGVIFFVASDLFRVPIPQAATPTQNWAHRRAQAIRATETAAQSGTGLECSKSAFSLPAPNYHFACTLYLQHLISTCTGPGSCTGRLLAIGDLYGEPPLLLRSPYRPLGMGRFFFGRADTPCSTGCL